MIKTGNAGEVDCSSIASLVLLNSKLKNSFIWNALFNRIKISFLFNSTFDYNLDFRISENRVVDDLVKRIILILIFFYSYLNFILLFYLLVICFITCLLLLFSFKCTELV
jgi:hypothetical protein